MTRAIGFPPTSLSPYHRSLYLSSFSTLNPSPQLTSNAPPTHTQFWSPGLCLPSIRDPEESDGAGKLEAEEILLWKLSF